MSECQFVEERIVDHLDGTLATGEAEAVRSHLASCATCAEMERSYSALQQAYRAVPEADVSEAMAQGLREAAREPAPGMLEPARPASRSLPTRVFDRWIGRGLLVAAAAVVAWIFVPFLVGEGDPSPVSFQSLVDRGDEEVHSGTLSEADLWFGRALERAATEEELAIALESLATIDARRGEHRLALGHLDELEGRAPSRSGSESVLVLRVIVLQAIGETEMAGKIRERLAGHVPDVGESLARGTERIEAMVEPDMNQELIDALKGLGYIGD